MKKISLIQSLLILILVVVLYSVDSKTNKQLFRNKAVDKNNNCFNANEDVFSSNFILMKFY